MNPIKRPSPNFNDRKDGKKISAIIIHYTEMHTAEEALERLCDPKDEVSAHYLIDKEGLIYQMVDDDKRAWHAGVSLWNNESDVNSLSLGIELDNKGNHPFPEVQMDSLIALCKDLMDKYNVAPENVIGHCHVAPDRKIDPGPFFPWNQLYELGLSKIKL